MQRLTRRWMGPAAVVVALAGVLVPAAPTHAFHGIGMMKIANPSNGTFTSVTDEFPSPGSGLRAAPGDILKVKAWELKPNATYALWLIWPDAVFEGVKCRFANATTGKIMENALKPGVNLTAMKTNALGRFDRNLATEALDAYKAVLPVDPRAAPGTATICAREMSPVAEETTSQHVYFTITE